MPGSMDGLRLAAAIRDRWPSIHLIVVTGFAPPNRSELPRDSLFIQSHLGRLKSSQRYDTFNRPISLWRWRAFSAVGTRNLGKHRRRDSHSRRPLPAFALISIVHGKKTNRAVGKLFLILTCPVAPINDAPRNDLAHSTRIGWPGCTRFPTGAAGPRPHREPLRVRQWFRDRRPPSA
jgi:hypothetical protein